MDVISLLNSSLTPAEQLKRAGSTASRTPSRSRTPWDAGGYSLPIITTKNSIKSSQEQAITEILQDEILTGLQHLPLKQRISESCSPLSSFVPPVQSMTAQSSYSSTSTIPSNSKIYQESFGTDPYFANARVLSQTLESINQPLAINQVQANETQQRNNFLLADASLEQLALVADGHLAKQQTESSSKINDILDTVVNSFTEDNVTTVTPGNRPGSPSDAILIKRLSMPALHHDTEISKGYQQQYLSEPRDYFRPSHHYNKTHKTTMSEPNIKLRGRPPLVSDQNVQISLTSSLNTLATMKEACIDDQEQRSTSKSPIKKTSTPPPNVSPITSNAENYLHRQASLMAVNLNAQKSLDNLMAKSSSPVSNSVSSRRSPLLNINEIHPSMALSSARLIIPSPYGPTVEPTPPSSYHPDSPSPTTLTIYGSPATPPTIAQDDSNAPIVCEYVKNCDTGSQMRKAISHIFGRNKMCTRQIPQSVWVHFCRKHYQRSRYRNPKEYTRTQCGLVLKQIRQIHKWYEVYRRGPRDNCLSWTLAIRKREQKRIQNLEREETGKRKRSVAGDEDDDEEGDHYSLGHDPVTAVPHWLVALCGTKYSTSRILEIFTQLESDVWNGIYIATFPDIEVLPELDSLSKEPKSPKTYNKRNSTPASHRRTRSLGLASNDSPAWGGEELSEHDPPFQKRRRLNITSGQDKLIKDPYQYMVPSQATGSMESMRRVEDRAHSPMYTHPEECSEHQKGTHLRSRNFPHSAISPRLPLTAPMLLPHSDYPSTSTLARGSDFRPSMHSRSQSVLIPSRTHSAYPRPPAGHPQSNIEARSHAGIPTRYPGGHTAYPVNQPARPETDYTSHDSRPHMPEHPRPELGSRPNPSLRAPLPHPYHAGYSRHHQSIPATHPSFSHAPPAATPRPRPRMFDLAAEDGNAQYRYPSRRWSDRSHHCAG